MALLVRKTTQEKIHDRECKFQFLSATGINKIYYFCQKWVSPIVHIAKRLVADRTRDIFLIFQDGNAEE